MLNITDSEEQVKNIAALVDPEIAFISLVKNPSSRETFTVRRSAQEGAMSKSVHKVITKRGSTINDIIGSNPKATWLRSVTAQPAHQGEQHDCYCHMSEDCFVPGSFDMIPITRGDHPAWAVVGVLKDGSPATDAISLDVESQNVLAQRNTAIPTAPIAAMNGYGGGLSQAEMLGNQFYSEWYAMQDVLWGTLTQAALTVKQRKVIITASIAGFSSFVNMMLDALDPGDDSVQRSAELEKATAPLLGILKQTLELCDKGSSAQNITRSASADPITTTGGKDMALSTEDKREIGLVVGEFMRSHTVEAQRAAEEAAAKKRDAERDELIKRMATTIDTLQTKITTMETTQAATPATPATPEVKTEEQRAAAPAASAPEGEASLAAAFAGFFESRVAAANM